jgi:hypothetical protein
MRGMTREEIEAEADRLCKENPKIPPEARACFTAFLEHENKISIDQHSRHCNGVLAVEDRNQDGPGQAWIIKCPCGRTNDLYRGL